MGERCLKGLPYGIEGASLPKHGLRLCSTGVWNMSHRMLPSAPMSQTIEKARRSTPAFKLHGGGGTVGLSYVWGSLNSYKNARHISIHLKNSHSSLHPTQECIRHHTPRSTTTCTTSQRGPAPSRHPPAQLLAKESWQHGNDIVHHVDTCRAGQGLLIQLSRMPETDGWSTADA